MTEESGLSYVAVIHELLIASFTEDELRRFCRDRPAFQRLVPRLSARASLETLADEVVRWCQTREMFSELLAGVQEGNPRQYERFAARLSGVVGEQRSEPSAESRVPEVGGLAQAKSLMRDARRLYNCGSYWEARDLLRRVVELDPDSPASWGLLGKALERAGDFRDAIPVLTNALAITQANRRSYLHERGFCYVMTRQYGLAINDFDEAIKMTELSSTLRWRAIAYLELGGRDIALQDLDRALEVKPLYLCGHATRAVVLFRLGRVEEAAEELRRCEELPVRNADSFYCLAELYACSGQRDDALVNLRIALEREPKLRSRVYNNAFLEGLAGEPSLQSLLVEGQT